MDGMPEPYEFDGHFCYRPHETIHHVAEENGLAKFYMPIAEIRPGQGLGNVVYEWRTDDDVQLGPEGVIPIG